LFPPPPVWRLLGGLFLLPQTLCYDTPFSSKSLFPVWVPVDSCHFAGSFVGVYGVGVSLLCVTMIRNAFFFPPFFLGAPFTLRGWNQGPFFFPPPVHHIQPPPPLPDCSTKLLGPLYLFQCLTRPPQTYPFLISFLGVASLPFYRCFPPPLLLFFSMGYQFHPFSPYTLLLQRRSFSLSFKPCFSPTRFYLVFFDVLLGEAACSLLPLLPDLLESLVRPVEVRLAFSLPCHTLPPCAPYSPWLPWSVTSTIFAPKLWLPTHVLPPLVVVGPPGGEVLPFWPFTAPMTPPFFLADPPSPLHQIVRSVRALFFPVIRKTLLPRGPFLEPAPPRGFVISLLLWGWPPHPYPLQFLSAQG